MSTSESTIDHESLDPYFEAKAPFYKTARALVSCALFKAGDFVAVRYSNRCACHTALWFDVTAADGRGTAYPAHHLADFCL